MMLRRLAALLASFAAGVTAAAPDPFVARPEVRAFIGEMVQRHGFVANELEFLFSRARSREDVLRFIAPPKEPRERSWQTYRARFVNDTRIRGGVAFWRRHASTLARAAREHGVPEEIIVAIIGVETLYGRQTGNFRVVDSLATLAFDYPPRAAFFRAELEQYLLLARDESFDVFSVKGSYAGAIGIPQFMPGSIRRYAVDYDGNARIDLRKSPVDAIGSVANFLRTAVKAHADASDGPGNGGAPGISMREFRRLLKEKMEMLQMDSSFARRYLNEGFSGGEKKRMEILQMAMLQPEIAILDETDSGLDIDALRIVSEGVNQLMGPELGVLIITHYQRILNYVRPRYVHIMVDGRLVLSGGPELALELEDRGYDWIKEEAATSK